MTATEVRTTHLDVYIDDVWDDAAVACTCSFGFDQRYAEATITRTGSAGALPITYWSTVEVRMGVSPGQWDAGGGDGVDAVRFRGYVVPVDNDLWPIQGVLHCKGRLYRAAWVRNPAAGGTAYAPSGGPFVTDADMVKDVLTKCGVPYTASNIGGTGETLGSQWVNVDEPLTASPFTWAEQQAGLDFIESVDAASVPDTPGSGVPVGRYRTFESLDGTVFRIPLATVPAATADVTFTEGVDVLDARIGRDPAGAANRVRVTGGLAVGGGGLLPTAWEYTVAAPSGSAPYLPPGLPNGPDGYPQVTVEFSSPLLEKPAIADAGPGLACQAVADHLLAEVNCVLDTLEFSTPRDDLLGPGQTIHLTSARLGLTDPTRHYWLQRLESTMDERGVFTQRLTCIRRS